MSNYDKLDSIFGTHMDIIPKKEETLPAKVEPVSTGDDIEDDYNVARKKLNELIDKGQEAIDGMMNVARGSDSPRAYEVVGQLIKTTADTAKDLMDLQQKKKKLLDVDTKNQTIETQNNIVFAGSTKDLLKALKSEREKIIDHE